MRRQCLAHAHELAVIGDEESVAAAIERYSDAGATEMSIAYTDIGTPEEQARTIGLLGRVNRSRAWRSSPEGRPGHALGRSSRERKVRR